VLISGGGGGTSRAMIQGLLNQVERGRLSLDDAQVSSLRLGSGNVVPKHFDLPAAPVQALREIAEGMVRERHHPCCVYRCKFYAADGAVKNVYGMTLGALGPFARVPADAQRAKTQHRRWLRVASCFLSLEQITTLQYVAFGLSRTAACVIAPSKADLIAIRYEHTQEQLRIVAGLLLNFDVPQLPVRAQCAISDGRLSLCLVPCLSRRQTLETLWHWRTLGQAVRRYELTPERPIDITFLGPSSTVIALDEDTFRAPTHLKLEVAGTVKFITGAAYKAL
jgi:diacylglycerol kinase family enzyme